MPLACLSHASRGDSEPRLQEYVAESLAEMVKIYAFLEEKPGIAALIGDTAGPLSIFQLGRNFSDAFLLCPSN